MTKLKEFIDKVPIGENCTDDGREILLAFVKLVRERAIGRDMADAFNEIVEEFELDKKEKSDGKEEITNPEND